jgi:predicted N-formylglutamate amidohydrolase
MTSILKLGEMHPAQLINVTGPSPFLLICEHASNAVPTSLGTLGLQALDFERHIAYDMGTAGVTAALSKMLDCAAVMQRYSRLVYDCNRAPESPGAMPEKSEVFDIPGNVGLLPRQKLARVREIYRPFMRAIDDVIDDRTCRGQSTIVISIHSFTPVYFGNRRAVEVGLLFQHHDALARKLLHAFPGFDTQLNDPYGPEHGVMHLMNQIAAPRGLPHLMLEIRNDLITTGEQQNQWAERLAAALIAANT